MSRVWYEGKNPVRVEAQGTFWQAAANGADFADWEGRFSHPADVPQIRRVWSWMLTTFVHTHHAERFFVAAQRIPLAMIVGE